jgi:hypothetical protein
MNAITYGSRGEDLEADREREDEQAPRHPRRQFFNRRSAALAALITCAGGFYAGVRVEKAQLSGSTTSAGGSAAAVRAGTAGPPAGARPFGGGNATLGGANASFGTVTNVDGKNIYVSDGSGNTIKVTLSSATRISKSVSVSRRAVRPGDTVVIQGLKRASGTVIATSVNDSGPGATNSSGSVSKSSSGSSAVSSLFTPGGG